jgi:Na+-transporting NADH:ubiquinone oxidoreductase subunit F
MMFFTAVGSLVAVCAVLALLLVVADRYLNDYGTCRITINGGEKVLEVPGGRPLLGLLTSQRIFIPSACGGSGSCGLCKLRVTSGGGPLLATEEPHLSAQEVGQGLRVACQIKVRGDIGIEVPKALFAVREYRAVVAQLVPLTHDIRLLRLELVDPETMDFVPGAYVQLQTPPYKGSPNSVYRAYSLAGDPQDKRHIDLIIRLVPKGICTTWVFNHLKVGDKVAFNGPHGDFRIHEGDAEMIFIAGGSGMAPFRSILMDMRRAGCPRRTRYFFGAISRRDMFCLEEMKESEQALPDFRFIPALSKPAPGDAWEGEVGLITEVVSRHCPDCSGREAYLCGSPGMIDACTKVLTANGMKADRILYDKFA